MQKFEKKQNDLMAEVQSVLEKSRPKFCPKDYQKAGWGRNLLDGEYMVLHALAVTPGMHKTGIGKKIVEFCIDKAKEGGYKGIRLDFVPGNEPAKRLYEGCGFTYVGDEDIRPEIEHIPCFSLLEMYFGEREY